MFHSTIFDNSQNTQMIITNKIASQNSNTDNNETKLAEVVSTAAQWK